MLNQAEAYNQAREPGLDEGTAARQIDELVKRVHASMVGLRDQWVRYRSQSGVESRWRKSKILYDGSQAKAELAFVESLKTGPARRLPPQQRSRLVVNIVRPKVEQAVARTCEILLPTDGKNWGIRATPVPEDISRMIGDMRPTVIPGTNTPTGLTAHQEASAYLAAVEQAREGMEKAIDDDLQEGAYNAEQRKVIEDGYRLGTGVLFGPMPSAQYASRWAYQPGFGMRKTQTKKIVPRSYRYDPWDVWFDPACGNDHQRGQGVWLLKRATRKELRDLAEAPGFSAERISRILQTKPTRVTVVEGRVTRTGCAEDTYELWTYYGAIEPDQMTLCSWGTNGDPLTDVDYGVIVMCQDQIIGAMPYWLDEKVLPCDVWCYRKSDDSPYGHSLPEDLEHQQAAVIAAWRQVMDNGRNASGGQVVIGDGVEPADGNMTITPNKAWRAKAGLDVTKAFAVFNFNSHLEELLAIADAAMKFADQEVSMPQLLSGDQGKAPPETLGGMVMLFSNATAVLRYRAKMYDDNITSPHIGRYFDWHMQYNPDESIKGDMEIIAIGSTALLERDIANQGALNMINVTSNPRFEKYIDPKKELKVTLKAMRQKPEDIMFTDEEIAANEEAAKNSPPPQDPQAMRAQAVVQAKQMELEDREKQRQFDAQRAADEAQLKREALVYNRERDQGEYEIAMTDMSLTRDTTILKLDQTERLAAEANAAKERMQALDVDNDRQLFNAEAALRTSTGSGI